MNGVWGDCPHFCSGQWTSQGRNVDSHFVKGIICNIGGGSFMSVPFIKSSIYEKKEDGSLFEWIAQFICCHL
jgi:hypothetical protein